MTEPTGPAPAPPDDEDAEGAGPQDQPSAVGPSPWDQSDDPLASQPPGGDEGLLPPSPYAARRDVFRPEDAWDEPLTPTSEPYPPTPLYRRPSPDRLPPYEPTSPADYTIQGHEPAQRSSRWGAVGLALLAGIIGAGLATAVFVLFFNDDPEPTTIVETAPPVTVIERVITEIVPADPAITTDVASVAALVIPSIVTVDVGEDTSDGFQAFASGSGVVISSSEGHIVTNQHVVEDSTGVRVTFSDGRVYDAEVLGTDALTDLAVLQIEADELTAIEIGATDTLVIGDVAIAAGSPLGLDGGPTVTVGVISAFDRQVQTGPTASDQLWGLLQTDAPITRGSSGGALVDDAGRLIGITSAVGVSDVGVEGIGFAIPVELMIRVTEELIEAGSVEHAFLGITGRTEFASAEDGADVPVGVFVQSVEGGTAADTAGLQDGDIIMSVEGEGLRTMEELIVSLRRHRVGDEFGLVIDRDGEELLVTVELGPRPEDA